MPRFWDLGCGRLWGSIILAATVLNLLVVLISDQWCLDFIIGIADHFLNIVLCRCLRGKESTASAGDAGFIPES